MCRFFTPFLLFLFLPLSLLADVRAIHGLNFYVDSLVEVDLDTVKVAVLGQERIISRSHLDRFIVESYFESTGGDEEQRFSPDEVEKFFFQALVAKDTALASLALLHVLRTAEISKEEKRRIIFSASEDESSLALFKELLGREQGEELGEMALYLCAFVGADDLRWVRAHKISRVVRNRGFFFQIVHELVGARLEKEDWEGFARGILSFAQEVFGKTDAEVEQLSLLIEEVKSLRALEPTLDQSKIYSFFGDEERDTARVILRPLVVKKIHEFAQFALGQSVPVYALLLLSELFPEERTDLTQSLIERALTIVEPLSPEMRSNRIVIELLLEESVNSPRIREGYSNYLRRAFQAEVEAGALHAAAQLREQLRVVNMEAEDSYDRMILDEVLSWTKQGRADVADQLLRLRSTELGVVENLRLLLAGYYGSPLIIVSLLLIPILTLALLWLRSEERARMREVKGLKFDSFQDGETGGGPAPSHEGSEGLRPLRGGGGAALLEYKRLLGDWGLPWQASMSEIKTAYRTRLKQVHPDMNADKAGDTNDAFIQLSKNYERVLSLRSELHILDE